MYVSPLEGVPLMNAIGPEPATPRSPTKSRVLVGIASVMTVVLTVAVPTPLLVTSIEYCTIAPGIAFGVVPPLTGSEITRHGLGDSE